MRLIDEKGKLFGLINVLDLFLILLALLVVGGLTYKLLLPRSSVAPTKVTFVVRVPAVPPETARMVQVGDRMVAGAEYTGVKVIDVKVEPALTTETNSQGQKVLARDPYFKDVIVTLQGETPLTSAAIRMGNQEIRAGREYYVKSLTYELKGTIIKVSLEPAPDKPRS
ncbi:hypothetical protein Adeg_1974 [Ammonifex degensii KC4]|uniref:DUF4330 domain-containing protein n=1 Tax=Ammonifex degensii (strain DSM 10501 / KC4) TaxID=429009 RepID=C9R9S4_AMMDK|nr:DUF4330 domain-containing protein [Ammonifex degensii]ACX53053.1 hypothetical protein Adeg_1974 [Ammonifex degensii KC4]